MYPSRPDLHNKNFYVCFDCDASVGCHADTKTPLGSLADATLRAARQRSHVSLNQLMDQEQLSRGEVYRWLASELDITPQRCHIAQFDLETCSRVLAAVHARLGRPGRATEQQELASAADGVSRETLCPPTQPQEV